MRGIVTSQRLTSLKRPCSQFKLAINHIRHLSSLHLSREGKRNHGCKTAGHRNDVVKEDQVILFVSSLALQFLSSSLKYLSRLLVTK